MGRPRIGGVQARLLLVLVCTGGALASAGCGGGNSTPPDTPVLVDVLDGPCTAPGSSPFPLLPAEAVRLRIGAPWPSADLVVTANGTTLENVGPSDTQRQSDLKAAGTPYWIPANIDPNPSPPVWTVHVELPMSMRAGPLALTFTSRNPNGPNSANSLSVNFTTGRETLTATAPTWKRVELAWRDRGGETGYRIERSTQGGPFTLLGTVAADVSSTTDTTGITDERTYRYLVTVLGCPSSSPALDPKSGPADVTTPPGPKNGVETITLRRSQSDPFLFETDLMLFAPRWDALVSSLTNVAVDMNGAGLNLGTIRHTDSNGVSRSENPSGTDCSDGSAVTLSPQNSSAKFDGTTVTGTWTARVVCASNAHLRDLIDLKISWRAPH